MATLAAYPEWYERSGNVVLRQDITEVAVVNNYVITGNEVASWNAASEGSIMCYIVGTKLIIVWDSLTEIPDRMFGYFLSLETITGLGSVTEIGNRGFWFCHSLKSVDLDPTKLTSIGDDAFRMSNTEDVLDISKLPADVVLGVRATRDQRWGDSLTGIETVWQKFQNKIFLRVPNLDSQGRPEYADIDFAKDGNGVIQSLWEGCSRFTMYHAWNCLYAGTDKEYPNFPKWFEETLKAEIENYSENTAYTDEEDRTRDFETLGWNRTGTTLVASDAQLEYILGELSNGFPVYVTLRTGSAYHTVLLVGYDYDARKLAFADSGARNDKGDILWSAYEDLFMGGTTEGFDDSEVIRKLDYNQPVLAAGDSWFTRGTVKRASITEIEVVSNYTPTGNETASWDASVKNNGSVMAYVNGTKLTIAGNKPHGKIYGFDCVYAHPDSSYAFADSTGADYFTVLTTFNNASLLNTNKVVSMAYMLRNCNVLSAINVSNWDISSCRDIGYLFHRCPSIKRLDVSKWDTSNVERMENTFNRCEKVERLDVSNWNTSSCKIMASTFQHCYSITELNLSNWDTSHLETHPQLNTPMQSMLNRTDNLQKFALGDKFGFWGDISLILTAPSSTYIPYADGNWYDYDYNAYAPADIPSNVARTYYASKFIAAGDDDEMVFVKNGTLRKIAVALRYKNGKSDTMLPSEFADEVLALEIQSS